MLPPTCFVPSPALVASTRVVLIPIALVLPSLIGAHIYIRLGMLC
jgi:hypothetical protein